MPVEEQADRIIMRHPKGASAEILLYGATIISWRSPAPSDPEQRERLFLSSKAALDGSRAVRGGIPIVFPCFGPPSHPDHKRLPQHGFARNETWKVGTILLDTDVGVSVRLTLDPTPKIKALYDQPFHLAYVVTLAEHQLSSSLHVTTTGESANEALEFQALFHTYIRAPSAHVVVSPLQGLLYYDKTEASEQPKREERVAVDVCRFTDSVYEDAPQRYKVLWPGGALSVRSNALKDVVIWNPQKEAGSKLGDMEQGGWENFICVEPGHVRGFAKVAPGRVWIGQQVLTIIDPENQ